MVHSRAKSYNQNTNNHCHISQEQTVRWSTHQLPNMLCIISLSSSDDESEGNLHLYGL